MTSGEMLEASLHCIPGLDGDLRRRNPVVREYVLRKKSVIDGAELRAGSPRRAAVERPGVGRGGRG